MHPLWPTLIVLLAGAPLVAVALGAVFREAQATTVSLRTCARDLGASADGLRRAAEAFAASYLALARTRR